MHCVASHISSLLKSISCCTLHPIVSWGRRWIYKSQYKHVAVGTYLIIITHMHDHLYNVNQIVATCASVCAWGWRDPGKNACVTSYGWRCFNILHRQLSGKIPCWRLPPLQVLYSKYPLNHMNAYANMFTCSPRKQYLKLMCLCSNSKCNL